MKFILRIILASCLVSIGIIMIGSAHEVFGGYPMISKQNVVQTLINITSVLIIYYPIAWASKKRG